MQKLLHHSIWVRICVEYFYIITYKTVRMSYNRHKLYQHNQKVMDCE